MKLKLLPLLVAGLALTGCDSTQTNTNTPAVAVPTEAPAAAAAAPVAKTVVPAASNANDKADAVAVVNGQYIPKAALEELEKEIEMRSHGQKFPKEKYPDKKCDTKSNL